MLVSLKSRLIGSFQIPCLLLVLFLCAPWLSDKRSQTLPIFRAL